MTLYTKQQFLLIELFDNKHTNNHADIFFLLFLNLLTYFTPGFYINYTFYGLINDHFYIDPQKRLDRYSFNKMWWVVSQMDVKI